LRICIVLFRGLAPPFHGLFHALDHAPAIKEAMSQFALRLGVSLIRLL
jgi:hypothetical protein